MTYTRYTLFGGLLGALFIAYSLLFGASMASEHRQPGMPFDGNSIQFAFDIHDTLTYTQRKKALCKLGVRKAWRLARFYLKARKSKLYKRYGQTLSAEGLIALDPKLAGHKKKAKALLEFADISHVICPHMQAFLKDLARTYDLQVLSNIGPINWERMQKRYPQVFNEQVIHGGIIIDYAAGHKPKPDDEPFERFDRTCRQINPLTGELKTVIFVDDKQENVDAANKRPGWIGIRFTSLEKLQEDLAGLGVVVRM